MRQQTPPGLATPAMAQTIEEMDKMTEERTDAARALLEELESTVATIAKLIEDSDPAQCLDTDVARLSSALDVLHEAEDDLAAVAAPLFPFDGWDIIGDQPVTVKGWHGTRYRLDTGETARPSEVTTVFPAWYVRAKQATEDAADQADTQDDIRYGGAL